MANYKVLWFDDEWKDLEDITENALDFDIELVGVSNAKQGLEILKQNPKEFQGVILDGKFYLDASKTGDEVNDDAFGEVARYLHDLHTQGEVLPWFILSGQPTFVKEKNTSVKLLGGSSNGQGRVFDKNRDEDSELFKQLLIEIENTPLLRAYVKHRAVFEVCHEKYLGDQKNRLFEIIKNLELGEQPNTEDLFAPLRKILEKMIDRFADLGVTPKGMSLNDLKFFSRGRHNDYTFNEEIFPPLIAHLFNGVIDVIQDACHLKDDLRFKVDDFVHCSGTTYLYQSTAITLLELIVWFKSYLDESPDQEVCKKRWDVKGKDNEGDSEWILGEISSIQNGYGSFINEDGKIRKSIPSFLLKNIQVGCAVRITLKASNENHIQNIELVEQV